MFRYNVFVSKLTSQLLEEKTQFFVSSGIDEYRLRIKGYAELIAHWYSVKILLFLIFLWSVYDPIYVNPYM